MTTYCAQVSIEDMLRQHRTHGTAYIEDRDGVELSPMAQLRLIRGAQLMGMTWFPVCEHVDRTGRCQGHKTEGE